MPLSPCCPVRRSNNRPMHKQDGPWAWFVLGCAFLQSWFNVGMLRGFGVFLPVLMDEFNQGRDKIGKHQEKINQLREPIPHIQLCTHHEPRSSIFKRNVIGQIVKTLKTQNLKMVEGVGEEVHSTFADEDDYLVLEKCGKHKDKNWGW